MELSEKRICGENSIAFGQISIFIFWTSNLIPLLSVFVFILTWLRHFADMEVENLSITANCMFLVRHLNNLEYLASSMTVFDIF